MSLRQRPKTTEEDDASTVEQRIRELEAIEDELQLVAETDCAYASHAERLLNALEEVQ